jgi:hypothetical protein
MHSPPSKTMTERQTRMIMFARAQNNSLQKRELFCIKYFNNMIGTTLILALAAAWSLGTVASA